MRGSLIFSKRFCQGAAVLLAFAFLCESLGASIDHSTITEVVNSVKIIDPGSRHVSPAEVNGLFEAPEIMQTGVASRSEMVAADQTITRVGADTLFSFEPKSRTINLRQGSILFQSPSGKGGGTIQTESATASVLGTTIIVVATSDGGFKILVLEGTAQVTMPNGKVWIVQGGQLLVVTPGAKVPGPVFDFRLSDQVATSFLVNGFKRPLPSWGKIQKQIQKQNKKISQGKFNSPGVVFGGIADPNIVIDRFERLHEGPNPPLPTPTPGSAAAKRRAGRPAGSAPGTKV